MDLGYLLSAVYFYLPGAVANIGANLARFVPFLKNISVPVDGGYVWKGRRLIGEHKSWGGFLGGVLFGLVFGLGKIFIFDKYWPGTLFLSLSTGWGVLLIVLMSVGAVSGDIVKSVLKRVVGVSPHRPWIPFDEIDHTTMAMILVRLVFGVEWKLVFVVIGVYFVLHLVSNIVGYALKLKKVPY